MIGNTIWRKIEEKEDMRSSWNPINSPWDNSSDPLLQFSQGDNVSIVKLFLNQQTTFQQNPNFLYIWFWFFSGNFLSFEKLETWLASAFLSKVMSFHGRKLASRSWWQGLPYVDYRKKEVLTEFSKFQSCFIKFFFISSWCWAQMA